MREWRRGSFELVVSPRLLAELRDVLGRARLARYVTPGEAETFAAELGRSAVVVDNPPVAERLVPADPDDDYLVALARAGGAQAIVTGDADLLDIDLEPPTVTARAFLARLEELGL